MSQEQRFSDEFLNAFVDNQITAEEKSQAFIEIGRDEALNRQVCELRKLHDLVQLAYSEPPVPASSGASRPAPGKARLRAGVAASFLLMLGILLGSLLYLPGTSTTPKLVTAPAVKTSPMDLATLHKQLTQHRARLESRHSAAHRITKTVETSQPPAAASSSMPVSSLTTAAANPAPVNTKNKVLIHLARDDVDQLALALDDIEGMLKYYRDSHQNARVEVVVNGGGMELVRSDTSVFAARIQRLQREYSNLTFAACQNTIDRLAREQGITVKLLPGVITIDSGMAEIMRRQNQGWTYLQV